MSALRRPSLKGSARANCSGMRPVTVSIGAFESAGALSCSRARRACSVDEARVDLLAFSKVIQHEGHVALLYAVQQRLIHLLLLGCGGHLARAVDERARWLVAVKRLLGE